MKKNELLEQFYKRRKSLINRVLIATVILLILISVSLQFQKNESFVAKISIQGIIQDRKDILDQLEQLNGNENVKGLLIIINSPGGTYVASKEVHDSIKKISKKIPTAVYMREMATSGGYLASLSSDKIFGNEGTITEESIGGLNTDLLPEGAKVLNIDTKNKILIIEFEKEKFTFEL